MSIKSIFFSGQKFVKDMLGSYQIKSLVNGYAPTYAYAWDKDNYSNNWVENSGGKFFLSGEDSIADPYRRIFGAYNFNNELYYLVCYNPQSVDTETGTAPFCFIKASDVIIEKMGG